MKELKEECEGFRGGVIPSLNIVLAIETELADVYMDLVEIKSDAHEESQRATLARKRKVADEYLKLRKDKSYTASDADKKVYELVTKESDAELEADVLHTRIQTFMRAVDRAFEAARSVQSSLKSSEKRV